MAKVRLSKRMVQLAQVYPDVVLRYWITPRRHNVQLRRGWSYQQGGKSTHKLVVQSAGWLTKMWPYIDPCDCDQCVGADRGSALAIWRFFNWLPDGHYNDPDRRAALLSQVIEKEGYIAPISDADLVAVDQYLMNND